MHRVGVAAIGGGAKTPRRLLVFPHRRVHVPEVIVRVRVSLIGRAHVQRLGLLEIRRATRDGTVLVHHRQRVQALRRSALGGGGKPTKRTRRVRDTVRIRRAGSQQRAQRALRVRVPGGGGFLVPLRRPGGIRRRDAESELERARVIARPLHGPQLRGAAVQRGGRRHIRGLARVRSPASLRAPRRLTASASPAAAPRSAHADDSERLKGAPSPEA